jgi:thiamine biosynthesis lipoprotein
VGALGKGYATEKAAEHLRTVGADSYVLNIGGNIRIIGHKQDGGSWGTGIKDPADTSRYATVIDIADTSCVTSGDYERFFSVNGKKYHHIIDKDTLMPSEYFSSVTIITPDSGLADALSTALFSMSYEDGLRLISAMSTKVEVLWIFPNGEMRMSDGFKTLQSTK